MGASATPYFIMLSMSMLFQLRYNELIQWLERFDKNLLPNSAYLSALKHPKCWTKSTHLSSFEIQGPNLDSAIWSGFPSLPATNLTNNTRSIASQTTFGWLNASSEVMAKSSADWNRSSWIGLNIVKLFESQYALKQHASTCVNWKAISITNFTNFKTI